MLLVNQGQTEIDYMLFRFNPGKRNISMLHARNYNFPHIDERKEDPVSSNLQPTIQALYKCNWDADK